MTSIAAPLGFAGRNTSIRGRRMPVTARSGTAASLLRSVVDFGERGVDQPGRFARPQRDRCRPARGAPRQRAAAGTAASEAASRVRRSIVIAAAACHGFDSAGARGSCRQPLAPATRGPRSGVCATRRRRSVRPSSACPSRPVADAARGVDVPALPASTRWLPQPPRQRLRAIEADPRIVAAGHDDRREGQRRRRRRREAGEFGRSVAGDRHRPARPAARPRPASHRAAATASPTTRPPGSRANAPTSTTGACAVLIAWSSLVTQTLRCGVSHMPRSTRTVSSRAFSHSVCQCVGPELPRPGTVRIVGALPRIDPSSLS